MTITAGARSLLLGLTLILFAVAGCGNGSESEPPKQPAIVRKKIGAPKKPTSQAVKPKEGAAKEKVSETKAATKPLLEQARVEPPLPEKKPMMQQGVTTLETVREKIGEELTYFRELQAMTVNYDPSGKLDPFRPLFASEVERAVPAKKKGKEEKRLPLTPLQKVGLTHLNLVGIIISPTGNKGIVTDPSGKGYIITKGSYVGTNFGRVKQILKDRVVVEEEVEDFASGEMKPQTKELRLRTKSGQV